MLGAERTVIVGLNGLKVEEFFHFHVISNDIPSYTVLKAGVHTVKAPPSPVRGT